MKRVKFYYNQYEVLGKKAKYEEIITDNNDILLNYFLNDYRDISQLIEIISDIESVASGEKTFDDIQDTDSYWDFGEGAGYFECDKETAYLTCWKDSHTPEAPNVEMPLKELIGILKDWKKFLEKK